MFLGIDWLTALVKVSFQVVFAIVSAIPFSIAWNTVMPIYFAAWVPTVLLTIPYWHFVAIMLVISFLGETIGKLVPKIISINQSNNNN